MSTESLKVIHAELQKVMEHTDRVTDEMVGRNTYPLIDESAQPFDLYICIEIERIRGQVSHLKDNIHNELITRGDSYDTDMLLYWADKREEARVAAEIEEKDKAYLYEQVLELREKVAVLEDGPETLHVP